MARGTPNPTTPNRNGSNLLSAWSRSKHPVLPPGPPPRRTVIPAEAPPNTPTTTDRPRRLTVEPSLPRNVPTQPAAMRRAQEAQQAQQQILTPRRRVVPNILPSEPSEPYTPTKSKCNPNPPRPLTPPYLPRYPYPPPIPNPAATKVTGPSASQPHTHDRHININTWTSTATGPRITHTEIIHYPKARQSADYAALLATSTPEETWESRRKAPMVPPGRLWLESDLFALQWYSAIMLSYKQDAETGEQLGGTLEEQEEEKRWRRAGHLAGVGVDLELRRHMFEAELLRRARDMVLRDNGVMPRGALGQPARDGEPQAWSDGLAGTRMGIKARRGEAAASDGVVFFVEQGGGRSWNQ